ncbi:MAG: excisionase [Eubacteriales bacterium]|nr:excisionase [Eubacteriales bacterium]
MFTVDEASAYFHIGGKKMREIIEAHKGARWMLYNGNRIMIKKDQFAKWLDNQTVI